MPSRAASSRAGRARLVRGVARCSGRVFVLVSASLLATALPRVPRTAEAQRPHTPAERAARDAQRSFESYRRFQLPRVAAFDDTRDWVAQVSKTVGAVVPELVSWRWQVSERGGLARLDYTQNAINKTLVAPYSPRPAPGAPISAPISWDELDDPALRPDGFTIRDLPRRLAERGDLFRGLIDSAQRLPSVR